MGEKNHNSKAVKSRHKALYEIDELGRGWKMTDFNGTSVGSYWCFILWRTGRSSGTRTTNNELFWLSRSNEGTRRCSTCSNKEHQCVATDIQSLLLAVENRRSMYTRSRRLSLCVLCVDERKEKRAEEEENALSCFFLQQCFNSSDQCTSHVLLGEHQTIVRQWCNPIGWGKPMVSVFYPTLLCLPAFVVRPRRSLQLSLSRDFESISILADVELSWMSPSHDQQFHSFSSFNL